MEAFGEAQDGVSVLLNRIKKASWSSPLSRLCEAAAIGHAGLSSSPAGDDDDHGADAEAESFRCRAGGVTPSPLTTSPLQVPVPPLELDFITGPRTGERLTLFERRATMGRGEAATIQISDPMLANVSRIHCVFEYIGNRWHIRDNGSTNGTWRRLSCVLEPSKPTPLASGMSILAGVHEFRVEEGALGQWWLPSAASAVLSEMTDSEQH